MPVQSISKPLCLLWRAAAVVLFLPGAASCWAQDPLQELRLEVVFVVDTSSGNDDLLEIVQETVERTARRIKHAALLTLQDGAVRIGLVEFKDASSAAKPSRVTIPLTAKLEVFSEKLPELIADRGSSDEVKADVLAGLMMAIKEAGWSKNSSKHIILLGDAGAYLEGSKNSTGLSIENIITLARPATGDGESARQLAVINLHAVRFLSGNPKHDATCHSQFRQLAENALEFDGMYRVCASRKLRELLGVIRDLSAVLAEAVDALTTLRKTPER